MVILPAIAVGFLGLVWAGFGGRRLLWLHKARKLSDVTGTVVARDRQFTGRGYWTYPVVEFTTRDGTQVRRTFRQLTRPRIGRKLRIVYDPSALDGRTRPISTGLHREPMVYSVGLLLWLWLMTATGLVAFAGCIAAIAVTAR